jgi:hypothetical protein
MAVSIAWKRDLDEAIREATTSKKPILADFTAAPA